MSGPIGALTFDGAVRSSEATATLFLSIWLLAMTASTGNIKHSGDAVVVERLNKSGQKGTVPTLRQVLLLPSDGLNLGGIVAEDMAYKRSHFGSQEGNLECLGHIAVAKNSLKLVLALRNVMSYLGLIQGGQKENRSPSWRSANGKMGPDEPFRCFLRSIRTQLDKLSLFLNRHIEHFCDEAAYFGQKIIRDTSRDARHTSAWMELRVQVSENPFHVRTPFETFRIPPKLFPDDILGPQIVESLGCNHFNEAFVLLQSCLDGVEKDRIRQRDGQRLHAIQRDGDAVGRLTGPALQLGVSLHFQSFWKKI